MRQRILVVAVDTELRGMLARWLMAVGYAVELAESAKRAREIVASARPELTIVSPEGLADASDLTTELAQSPGKLIVVVASGDGASLPVEAKCVGKPEPHIANMLDLQRPDASPQKRQRRSDVARTPPCG